jgi:hypothetical protein
MTKATLVTKVALASSHEMTAFFDMTLRLSLQTVDRLANLFTLALCSRSHR